MALVKPVDEEFWKINSGFGNRRNPFPPPPFKMHNGIDLATPIGSNVYAVESGTITKIGISPSSGLYMIVDHDNNLESRYAHLGSFKGSEGDTVNQGQIIATTGNSGNTTGAHLHYGLRKNGRFVDPSQESLYGVNYRRIFTGFAAAFAIYKYIIPYLEEKRAS
ncbi:MAG: M23 family metallopeptidase [Promethearchaeota archaeon]|jgi:murein DD-endopeptidase MepM/ murein hydrolase activator NlpD